MIIYDIAVVFPVVNAAIKSEIRCFGLMIISDKGKALQPVTKRITLSLQRDKRSGAQCILRSHQAGANLILVNRVNLRHLVQQGFKTIIFTAKVEVFQS